MSGSRVVAQHDGWTELLHFNPDDSFTLEKVVDVQPVLDANKRRHNDNPMGWSKTKEWRHVASIPPIVQLKWIERYGADPLAKGNEDLLKRVLDDPEWRYLRTGGGILKG